MNFTNIIGTGVRLTLLMTPFFVLAVFISSCEGWPRKARSSLARRTALSVMIISMVIYLFGEPLFRYLGIGLDAFRIGAGNYRVCSYDNLGKSKAMLLAAALIGTSDNCKSVSGKIRLYCFSRNILKIMRRINGSRLGNSVGYTVMNTAPDLVTKLVAGRGVGEADLKISVYYVGIVTSGLIASALNNKAVALALEGVFIVVLKLSAYFNFKSQGKSVVIKSVSILNNGGTIFCCLGKHDGVLTDNDLGNIVNFAESTSLVFTADIYSAGSCE